MSAYLYRPLAAFNGTVLRFAGLVRNEELATRVGALAEATDIYLPGAFTSQEFLGERAEPADYRLTKLYSEVELRAVDHAVDTAKRMGVWGLPGRRDLALEAGEHQRFWGTA